jgi:hypothetical protein
MVTAAAATPLNFTQTNDDVLLGFRNRDSAERVGGRKGELR